MTFRACLLLLLSPLALGGCVTFETAPAPLTCDTRLEGRWLPVPNNAEDSAKLTEDDFAQVDAQCRTTISMSQSAGQPGKREATVRLLGFALGDAHYFALGDSDLKDLFGAGTPLDLRSTGSTALTLVRYRLENDSLSFQLVDADTVKRLSDEGKLQATTPDQMNYVVSGDAARIREVLLSTPELFASGSAPPMRMRRAPKADAP